MVMRRKGFFWLLKVIQILDLNRLPPSLSPSHYPDILKALSKNGVFTEKCTSSR